MIQTKKIKGSRRESVVKSKLRLLNINKYKFLHFVSIDRKLRKDTIAVSEAIGTILLLSIAMTVVGAIGLWAYNLQQPEEQMHVNLSSKIENEIVTIKHLGGEPLDRRDTLITFIIENSNYHHYRFGDSQNEDLDDSKWSLGDAWVRDMSIELAGFTDPKIEVFIKDTKTDKIILGQTLQEGKIINLPDLAVTTQDITFDFEGDDLVIRNWLNISATIWNIGNSLAQNVVVRFFDENELLIKDGKNYQIINISNEPGKNSNTTWVNFTTKYWGKRIITVKIYSNLIESNYRNNYATRSLFVEPTAPVIHGPDLEFSSYDVILSNNNPVHGDTVKITALIHNTGDEDIPIGKTVRVNIQDDKGALNRNYTFYTGLTAGTYHPCNFGVWHARPGGISILTVEADITEQVNETNEDNNNASRPVQIMPTIIVVDDDDVSAGAFDVFEEMASNLDASGVNFKWVKSDDEAQVPSYDAGQYPLKDFDIIIWMTGYDDTDTLTVDNIEALNRSLNNGSYLWLIGQDILTDITNNYDDQDGIPEPGEFAYDYLGVDKYTALNTPWVLEGIYDDPITNGTVLNTSKIVESEDRGVKLQPKLPSPKEPRDDIAGILKNDTLLGVGSYNSLRYYNDSKGFKVVFFGWEHAGINNIINRVNLTYHVLKWFNWSISIGKDFAVSSEEFSTITPKFMDQLTISATIRNNGPLPGDNVRVMFYISGPEGVEEPIPKHPDNKDNPQTLFVPGDGGEITVYKKWLAVAVGRHNFRVMVDPYNEYDEVSEENNDVEYTDLFITELFIRYNILVVDDDNSTNNAIGGTGANVTYNLTNTLEFLGYHYDLHVIQGGFAPDRGPNKTIMKFYNTIIWLTGNQTDYTLWTEDQDNLTAYLEGDYYEAQYLGETKVNLWLIGQDILDDLDGPGINMVPQNQFVQDILQVSQYSTGVGLPNILEGVNNDPITHGITYPMNKNAFIDNGDSIVPNLAESATGIFWQNTAQTQYNSLKRNASRYNVIFYPWESSFIDNPLEFGGGGPFAHNVWDTPGLETYQAELVYLTLHWLGFPETRIELKTSKIDIELSNFNPMLGSAYVINSNIYNYGVNETSVVVRFFDGNTIIDTKSVYVGIDDSSSIEVIWRPLFAGPRTLTIAVDAANDIPEVFEVLNNNASLKNQQVYFFFDDMENGTANWKHDNTIVRINGESPILFLGTEEANTTILSSWNYTVSGKFAKGSAEYHSYNYSFYTMEPAMPAKALDIVLTLDNTENMTNDEIDQLKIATKNFIINLEGKDRVALYTHDTNSAPFPYDPFNNTGMPLLLTSLPSNEDDNGFIQMNQEYECPIHNTYELGQNLCMHLINLIDNTGGVGRPLWNLTHAAIDKAFYDSNSSNVAVVIAMARGDNATSTWQYPQGQGPQNNSNGYGDGIYWPESPNNPSDDWSTSPQNGEVCNSSKRVYTVGLNFSGGMNSVIGKKLNETAQSSNASYYYCNLSSELSNTYNTIRNELRKFVYSFGPGARSSSRGARGIFFDEFEGDLSQWDANGPNPSTKWDIIAGEGQAGSQAVKADKNDDGYLISDNINLANANSATLEFYYRLDTNAIGDFTLEYYDGTGYNFIAGLGNQPQTPVWNHFYQVLDLATYKIIDFRIRFDATLGNFEFMWIDNVWLNWTEPAPPPPPPEPGEEEEEGFLGNVTDPGDRNLTTETFSLVNVSSATLSFYHKYNLASGINGVVIQVGTFNGTNWSFEYVIPYQLYPGNFNNSETKYDDYGNDMRWCYNGISGNGRFTWDYVEVELDNWTGQQDLRVRFLFMWSNWSYGGGYYIDDVEIRVTRNDDANLTTANLDQWGLTSNDAHSGNYCWWNRNPQTGNLSGGLDNSLYSRPIDLTNARNATLSGYFKFNINSAAGLPPDGFRVEISDDNGVSWKTITLGVRAAWGVSGNESDIDDGIIDGKSYTGLDPDNDRWVEAGTLTRLNCDISGWTGNVILIRFRVVTASDDNPYFGANHYEWYGPGAAFGGFYVDDITITGYSLLE